MKRDMDFIRHLLLQIEEGTKTFTVIDQQYATALGMDDDRAMTTDEAEKYDYHLNQLALSDFVSFHKTSGGLWLVEHMTPAGHDFLDAVRDPRIWKQTKVATKKAGGFTLDMIKEVATELVKKGAIAYLGLKV
jgi:hypothetical protein